MKNFWISFCFLLPAIFLLLFTPDSSAQLTQRESRILLQVQKLLEYPPVLQEWSNWTNFCFLPPSPSLKIVCSSSHVTELTIVGNKSSPSRIPKPASRNSVQTLSGSFSTDAFFSVLTKLSNLKALSLVSLGLWGPLPSKINRLWSLEVLNISSNFIYGEIPSSISSLRSLKSLVLAYNLFNGSIPDLRRLTSLEELNLGGNKLGPEFPSVSSNLASIVLKNNSLRSQIPSELNHFNKLQQFDISSNGFYGNIPSFVFSLPSIQYLSLGENSLTGGLSVNITCSSALKFLDISHNLLVGKLPPCIGSKSPNRTVLYSWNCLSTRNAQHPSSHCKEEGALAVKPTPRRSQKEESGVKLGLIFGIIGGVVGIAGLLALLVLFILRKSEAERAVDKNLDRSVADKFSLRTSPRPYIDARRIPQTMRLAAIGLPPYRIFTLEEIEDSTNNFDPSNFIEGSQGQLYKGWLRDGSVVLVASVKLKQKNLPQNLMQHMEALSNLRHRYLVSVLGHCIVTYQDNPQTTSTVYIVFEHISNGSLRDHLTDWRKKEMLKWPQRMAISIGIARGVQFLHTGVVPGIYGNNLKIENILMDDSLNARISGYNIPLPSQKGFENTLNEQSAPNHVGSTDNAEKEDIYQLGVILLEIITGKRITSASEVEDLKDELERGLSEAASLLRSATDPTIRGTYAYDSMRTAAQITINCLGKVSSNRPSIEDILWNLQYSMQVQEAWTSSGNLSSGNLGTRF